MESKDVWNVVQPSEGESHGEMGIEPRFED